MRNLIQTFPISNVFTFRLQWFLAGCLFVSIAGWFFNTFPPEQGRVTILIGLILITSIIWSFLISFIKNVRRVIMYTLLIAGFIFLRTAQLFDTLYYLILFAFIITLNAALKK